jgi:hypothetical protein
MPQFGAPLLTTPEVSFTIMICFNTGYRNFLKGEGEMNTAREYFPLKECFFVRDLGPVS